MNRYWTTLLEEQRRGLTVIVDKSWEDIHPSDLFDTSVDPDTNKPYFDIDEICSKIDRGDLDWFMLRVRVMHNEHELASEIVGGFLYEDAAEVLTDGTAEDMISEAMAAADLEIPKLIQELLKIQVDNVHSEAV